MFCIQCGAKCADDTRFCEKCGSPLIPPSQAPLTREPYQDAADDPFEEIVANVQREQFIPPPAPVSQPVFQPVPQQAYRPFPPPAPAWKRSGGAVAAALVVLFLLAAVAAGAFFVLRIRTANQKKLEANLSQYMRDYCLPDIEDYYDGVFPKKFNADGYTIELSSSRFQSANAGNAYDVSGRFDVTDETRDGVICRVNVEGTVTTNFMHSKHTWDLDYDFEAPPAIADGPGTDMPADPPEYYIWPTDTQYITYNDLYLYGRHEIKLMRNELYARHGCSFRDEEIRNYFLEQSWYTPDPDLPAVDFSIELFTDIERANLDMILDYERDMGWRQ